MKDAVTAAPAAASSRSSDLEPIKSCVMAQLPTDAFIEEPGAVVLFGHRPDRGTGAFAIELFPGISTSTIERYETLHQIELPTAIREMLRQVNGCNLLQLSIFGIPPAMAQEPPLLSPDRRNPYDLGTAVRIWRHGYPSAVAEAFHFASRDVGWDSQVGYFLRPDGSVTSCSKSIEIGEVGRWESFAEWLRLELDETQRHSEAFEAEVRRKEIELNEAGRKSTFRKKKPE